MQTNNCNNNNNSSGGSNNNTNILTNNSTNNNNTNSSYSVSSLFRKYKSTRAAASVTASLPLTLPGIETTASQLSLTSLPPSSLNSDPIFLPHGSLHNSYNHSGADLLSEPTNLAGLSGTLNNNISHLNHQINPSGGLVHTGDGHVDILAPSSTLVTASSLVAGGGGGGSLGDCGSSVCSSASLASAAAYAYRNTPYYYFYPGAPDFAAAFDTGGLNSAAAAAAAAQAVSNSSAVGEPEQCKVCGDYASGVHFGVLTCEGCKGFFKRNHRDGSSISNSDSKGSSGSTPLTCNRDQKCEINVASRNSCRSCRYRKCLSAGMSRESIKLGRRSKNEKVILSKDCEKSSARNNGLMTFISPRSLGNPHLASFSPYHDLKSPLKPFSSSPSYNVTDGYLNAHRSSNYGLSFDYPNYRSDAHSFYIPTQPNTGGIYSGINPMEPINSFDLYGSSAANQNGLPPTTSMPQLSALGSNSNILPSLQMPKLEPVINGSEIQPNSTQRDHLSLASTGNNIMSSPIYSNVPSADFSGGAANFNTSFLTHQSAVNHNHHGFFSANQNESLNNFASHNSVNVNGHTNNSWSIIDHIVTY